MPIEATHSDGRSVRRGTLAVDREGLVFEPARASGGRRLRLPAETLRRTSVEGRVSGRDVIPRRRVRVDSVGGVGHWFVVHDPDATASLIEAVTADPPPHPAIVERRRRDAGRRNPLGFLRCQLVLVLLLIGGAAIRALEPGAIGIADVMIVVGTTLMAAYVLLEMWRYRRYRLTP